MLPYASCGGRDKRAAFRAATGEEAMAEQPVVQVSRLLDEHGLGSFQIKLLIWSNLLFGVFTFAAAHATNLDQMFWLRLIAGLGIGGVIPNVVAINAESAPRQYRATMAIIAVGCVPIGGAIPGFITAIFVPD